MMSPLKQTLQPLSDKKIGMVCARGLEERKLAGKKVLAIIPDATRSGPIPLLFRKLVVNLCGNVERLDFVIATGTHPAMNEEQINKHLGTTTRERQQLGVSVFNHAWDNPDLLRQIGMITKKEMECISRGLLVEDVPVQINSRVFEYDHLIIVGPVFPHEVVGFSGGYKYFFPGISGPDMVHESHWLGALVTNPKVNGTKWTPVREMIHRAASFVDIPTTLIAFCVKQHETYGMFIGDVVKTWEKAADLAVELNVVWISRSFDTVFSIAPPMYDELWTAGKCMYKLEPVVSDGGEVIIYAPHIEKISPTHGEWLLKVGYHTRDYFLGQAKRFADVPRAVLAHSTHVKGIGTYIDGIEKPRVDVTLATGIPKDICGKINLGYIDPSTINSSDYTNCEDDGILLVPEAGEMLYRLSDGSVPDIDDL